MNDYNTRMQKYEINEETSEEEVIETPRLTKWQKAIIIGVLILILIIAYGITVETKVFGNKEYKVESALIPSSFDGFKIVQFSDIHYGTSINKEEIKRIVSNINKLKPDILVFTGDLVDKSVNLSEDNLNYLIEEFGKLDAKMYKFAIYGDDDYHNDYYKDILDKSGFILLNNETKLIYFEGNTPILISGFSTIDTNPDYSILNKDINGIQVNGLYKIVLTHQTNSIDELMDYSPSLILGGDTLGGLVNIIRPIFINKDSNKHYKEYEKIQDTDIYISNGLGTNNIQLRLNNYPSFNLFRLYNKS